MKDVLAYLSMVVGLVAVAFFLLVVFDVFPPGPRQRDDGSERPGDVADNDSFDDDYDGRDHEDEDGRDAGPRSDRTRRLPAGVSPADLEPLACKTICTAGGAPMAILNVNWPAPSGPRAPRSVSKLAITPDAAGFYDRSYGEIELKEAKTFARDDCLQNFVSDSDLKTAVRECSGDRVRLRYRGQLQPARREDDRLIEDIAVRLTDELRVLGVRSNGYVPAPRDEALVYGVRPGAAYYVGIVEQAKKEMSIGQQRLCLIRSCRGEEDR